MIRRVLPLYAIMITGCTEGKPPPPKPVTTVETAPKALSAAEIRGTWALIRADGLSLSAFNIKSQTVELLDDGTMRTAIEMQGPFDGVSMSGDGTWKLGTDGVVSITMGETSDRCRVRLEGGHLLVDPDFLVRRGGKEPVTGEYQRK